ncbi:hypothetical protein DM15PD_10220 [Aristophania vespae]|nr:hypothetical protein DM15PD_10220 [Aristophania vespae]
MATLNIIRLNRFYHYEWALLPEVLGNLFYRQFQHQKIKLNILESIDYEQ